MKRLLLAVPLLGLLASPASAGTFGIAEQSTTVGDICTVVTVNNESVWPGNVMVIVSGNQRVEVPGVEDVSGQSHSGEIVSDGLVTVTVEAAVFTSLEVTVNCEPPPPETTTTTTEQETTTTEQETTTTTEETTTTTTPSTTTTTEEELTTTTPLPTTTTTAPIPTTTVTTTPPNPGCGPNTLACTGPNGLSLILFIGGGMLALGLGVSVMNRLR